MSKRLEVKPNEEKKRLLGEVDRLVATGVSRGAATDQLGMRREQYYQWRRQLGLGLVSKAAKRQNKAVVHQKVVASKTHPLAGLFQTVEQTPADGEAAGNDVTINFTGTPKALAAFMREWSTR